jgi:hypothetical protein
VRTANYKHLEAAVLVGFKQARFKNALVSDPPLTEKADIFAGQMELVFCE